MKESRITRNIYILMGATLFLLLALVLAWYFGLVRGQRAKLLTASTQYATRLETANKLPQAQIDQKKAEDRLQYVNGQFNFVRQRYRSMYFGDIGADYATETAVQKANREAIWRNWMNYYYNGYGPALRKELQDYATASGVNIVSSIAIVAPPNKPEDVAPPASGLMKPLSGTATAVGATGGGGAAPAAGATTGADGGGSMNVTVIGTLPNILRYFNSLNNNSTLIKVGTIKLDTDAGTAGRVRATFILTPYLLSNGPGARIAGDRTTGSAGIGGSSTGTLSASAAPVSSGSS